jgi:hypothetical protein
LLLVINAGVFLNGFFPNKNDIFNEPPGQTSPNQGLFPLAREAANRLQPCDTLWLDKFNQSYMYYLFSTQYPPARYQQDDKVLKTNEANSILIPRFGQVYIGQPSANDYRALPQTLRGCSDPAKGKVYWLTQLAKWTDTGLRWQSLQNVTNAKGELFWSLLQLTD